MHRLHCKPRTGCTGGCGRNSRRETGLPFRRRHRDDLRRRAAANVVLKDHPQPRRPEVINLRPFLEYLYTSTITAVQWWHTVTGIRLDLGTDRTGCYPTEPGPYRNSPKIPRFYSSEEILACRTCSERKVPTRSSIFPSGRAHSAHYSRQCFHTIRPRVHQSIIVNLARKDMPCPVSGSAYIAVKSNLPEKGTGRAAQLLQSHISAVRNARASCSTWCIFAGVSVRPEYTTKARLMHCPSLRWYDTVKAGGLLSLSKHPWERTWRHT